MSLSNDIRIAADKMQEEEKICYFAEHMGLNCGDNHGWCSDCISEALEKLADRVEELEKRAMPEGYKWPIFDDNKPIMFGEKAQLDNAVGEIQTFELHRNGYFTIVTVDDDGNVARKRYTNNERVERPKPDPIGADGLPIKNGDTVWFTSGDGPYVVAYTVEKDLAHPDLVVLDKHESDWPAHAAYLTHTKPEPPDSWEKWRKDVSVSPCEYFGYQSTSCEGCQANNSGNCSLVMARELERRAKALTQSEVGK